MYFITGAAGHLGRAVINHLLTTCKVPASKILAGTRQPSELADLAAEGVGLRMANFDDDAQLAKAFSGATRLLLISTNAMEPGQRLRQHQNAVRR